MATKYKAGDKVVVETRSDGLIFIGRYTLVELNGPKGSSWQAKHHKTGRTITLYDDEFVLAPQRRAASKPGR